MIGSCFLVEFSCPSPRKKWTCPYSDPSIRHMTVPELQGVGGLAWGEGFIALCVLAWCLQCSAAWRLLLRVCVWENPFLCLIHSWYFHCQLSLYKAGSCTAFGTTRSHAGTTLPPGEATVCRVCVCEYVHTCVNYKTAEGMLRTDCFTPNGNFDFCFRYRKLKRRGKNENDSITKQFWMCLWLLAGMRPIHWLYTLQQVILVLFCPVTFSSHHIFFSELALASSKSLLRVDSVSLL